MSQSQANQMIDQPSYVELGVHSQKSLVIYV